MNEYTLKLHTYDPELLNLYRVHAKKHNIQMLDPCPNSGFDLITPMTSLIKNGEVSFVNMLITVEMVHNVTKRSSAFYLYPRSSISKTVFMLANNVGIIDSGYRGNIIAAFVNLSDAYGTIKQHDKLVQICAPSLQPFNIEIVDSVDCFTKTSRGEGGFGSTNTDL